MVTRRPVMDSGWRNYLRRVPNDCVFYDPGLRGGGSVLVDYSGQANNGTIAGATWTRLSSGLWVLDFDGSDDFVSVSDAGNLRPGTSDFTILVWGKLAASPNNIWGILVGKGTTGAGDWNLRTDQNGWELRMSGAAETPTLDGTTDISDDVWHLMAFVRNGDNGYIYVDGIAENTSAGWSTSDMNSPDALVISANAANRRWHGGTALPRLIIGKAFSATEMSDVYNQERHLFGV